MKKTYVFYDYTWKCSRWLLLDPCKFYQYHVWRDLEESKIDRIEENHCINSFFDSKLNFCQSNKALHILAKKPSLKELMEASKTYCNHRCGCHRNRQTELRVQEHLGLIPIRVPNMTLVAYCYPCLSDSRTPWSTMAKATIWWLKGHEP